MPSDLDNTIAAIATPIGNSGIGIIRISGQDSLTIAECILQPFPSQIKPRYFYLSHVIENGNILDEVLFVFFKDPNSYTRENIIEIHSHGNFFVLKKTLALILKKGARQAFPGEFSKRAFLNGRIDLTQAQAVNQIITAQTELINKIGINNLNGKVKTFIESIRKILIDVSSSLEYIIDFEETESANYTNIYHSINTFEKQIRHLINNTETLILMNTGVSVLIYGKPNVGKSTLFNTLLNNDRAIVSDTPGTTRDFIEATISVNGLPVQLIDSAGIRETEDNIEKIGVEKTNRLIATSNVILLLTTTFDRDIYELNQKIRNSIIVCTKSDLRPDLLSAQYNKDAIDLSVFSPPSIHQIKEKIYQKIITNNISETDVCLSNEYQLNILKDSLLLVDNIKSYINDNVTPDILSDAVTEVIEKIDVLTGKIKNETIINHIFSSFCVGK